ncbi:MAG: hypothetical protein GQ523_09890 [Methanophagales archaeon]|jgi:hypothetical protein|nr:hypothetical protein [Methanophagales archaeon]
MLKNKAFTERTIFLEENFTFLAQVLSLERKCVDVRGMFDGEAEKLLYMRL